MCVEVADGTVDLAFDADARESLSLPLQAIDEVRDLLAERRGRRRLSVRPRHHRGLGVRMGHDPQPRDQRVEPGQQHLIARFLEHERVAQIVDVLGSAREMHELATRTPGGNGIEAALDEVFDRFHIVIGLALDPLDLHGIGVGELGRERIEDGKCFARQTAQLRDQRLCCERFEPERFDAHSLTYQPALTEERAQLGAFVGISPIDRGDRI